MLNYLVQCHGHSGRKPFPNTPNGTLGKGINADRFGVKPFSANEGFLKVKMGKVHTQYYANSNFAILVVYDNNTNKDDYGDGFDDHDNDYKN